MQGNHQQSSVLTALIKQNLITTDLCDEITADFDDKNKPFIRFLVEDKSLDAEQVAKALAKAFGFPQIRLADFDISLVPEGVRNEKLISKHNALPLYLRGKVLFVAMSDPTNMDALEEIQFNTGFSTELVLCDEISLQACIEKVLEDESDALDISDIDSDELAGIDVEDTKKEEDAPSGDDAPIVVFINKILLMPLKKALLIYTLSLMKNLFVFVFALMVFWLKLPSHQSH
jgi:type IV pilus assembly protein PilB